MASIEQLRDRIRSAPLPATIHYLNRLSVAVGGAKKYPTDSDVRAHCGDELAITLNSLMELIESYDSQHRSISELMDETITESDVDKYLECNKMVCQLTYTLILLVDHWIETHRKIVPASQLEGLLREICLAHDTKWTQQHNVTLLYSDGEITSQKGGELYGLRSVFTLESALPAHFECARSAPDGASHLEWQFPMSENEQSYAIVESLEVARAFREKMVAISRGIK